MSTKRRSRPPSRRPGGKRNARKTVSRPALWIAAVVGVVGLAAIIAAGTVAESEAVPTVAEVAGTPAVDGPALPPFGGDPVNDDALGQHAPTVAGADFEANPVAIGTGDSPELIVFMASWCPHCQVELPHLVDWMAQGRLPDDVQLTAVVTGLDARRPKWPPQDWFREEGYTGRVLVDDADGSVAEAFGLSGTPFWVALDAQGRVVLRIAGAIGMETVDQIVAGLRN